MMACSSGLAQELGADGCHSVFAQCLRQHMTRRGFPRAANVSAGLAAAPIRLLSIDSRRQHRYRQPRPANTPPRPALKWDSARCQYQIDGFRVGSPH